MCIRDRQLGPCFSLHALPKRYMEQLNLILGSSEVLGSWIFAAGHIQQAQLVRGAERTPSELVCECAAYYRIIVLGTSFCCLTGSWRAGTAATGAPLQDRKSSSTAAAVTTGAPIHTAQKPSNKPLTVLINVQLTAYKPSSERTWLRSVFSTVLALTSPHTCKVCRSGRSIPHPSLAADTR